MGISTKRWLTVTGIMTGISAAVGSAVGPLATNRPTHMTREEDEVSLQRGTPAKRFDEGWYNAVSKTERWVNSPNGYRLKAVLLEPLETSHYVVISHGVTENKINSVKYARMFERLGFNSVIYDHRRHGDSECRTTSFGHYEKSDLVAVIVDLRIYAVYQAITLVHA